MVVHGNNTPCNCTQYGAYAVRSESNRLMLPSHYQIGIAPPEGCAHFSFSPTTYSSYLF